MTIRQSRTLATLEVRAFETIRSAIVNLNVRMIGVQRRSSWTIQLRLRLCAPDMANVSQWSRKIGICSTQVLVVHTVPTKGLDAAIWPVCQLMVTRTSNW